MKSSRLSGAGAAAVIILACISGCAEGEERVSFIRIEYLISEVMGPPETLTITNDGTARLESFSNFLSRGKEPVGLFETRFDAARLAALSSAIDDPPFESIPSKKTAADGYRRIRVTRPSGNSERGTDHRTATDPRLANLIAQLDRAVDEVKRHPLGTLLLHAASVHMDRDGRLEAVLTFANPGTQPVRIVNPALPAGAVLSVRTQPDIPDAQLKSIDIDEAKAAEVRPAQAASEPPETVIQLAPGDSVSFGAKFALEKKPRASSLARFTYQQTARQKVGQAVLATELYSPNIPVQ